MKFTVPGGTAAVHNGIEYSAGEHQIILCAVKNLT